MTRQEQHAAERFETYLLISGGDVEKALAIHQRFAPKDMKYIRKVVKAAK